MPLILGRDDKLISDILKNLPTSDQFKAEQTDPRLQLIRKFTPGVSPYESIFKRVFTQELGQPESGDLSVRALSTTSNLASQFVDEYLKQVGKLPSEEQISDFLATTINSGFAKKTLTGEITDPQIQTTLVQPAVKTLKEDLDTQQREAQQGSIEDQARRAGEERQSLLGQLSDLIQMKAIQSAQEQFGQQRKRLIEEEASLGRLNQPNTIIPASQLEQAQARGLSDLISNLKAKQLGLQSDVTGDVYNSLQRSREFGADLGLRKQNLAEQMRQFNQQQAFKQDQQSYQRDQDLQNRALSAELGRQMAESNKPGALDYLNTSLGGLSALAGLGTGLEAYKRVFPKLFGVV